MRKWDRIHPAAVFVYFLSVILITMLSGHPAVSVVSLIGAVLFYSTLPVKRAYRAHLFSLILFLILTLINPLFSKSGETVLFFFNRRPITLEALLYGSNAAVSLTASLYWLRCFSHIFTSDKLLYLFSRLSKKLALVLSMAIRFVPLFKEQYHKINDVQKALGLYRDNNIIDGIKGRIRVVDILITWVIEGGIVTAESMEARGYLSGRRSFYSGYRIRPFDILLIVLSVCCGVISALYVYTADFHFYPSIGCRSFAYSIWGFLPFVLLCLIPIIIHIEEVLRWKYSASKI